MPRFSARSRQRLDTCDERLQRICEKAIQSFDFTVLEGHRGKEKQNRMVEEGKSTLNWPDSKHNEMPSMAVDVAPWPIDWEDRDRFIALGAFLKGIAYEMGIPVRWGGDWDGDWDMTDQSFHDLPHLELRGET